MIVGLCACGKTTNNNIETETVTEPMTPTNLFINQSPSLNNFSSRGNNFALNANLDQDLLNAGFSKWSGDTGVALTLGYPKGDASYLYYKYDANGIDCIYCCIVDEYCKITVSFRTIMPEKLNIDTPQMEMSANTSFSYADYITINTKVKDALSILGEPTNKKTDDDGVIQGMTYIYKNAEGKTTNKLELEFAAERLYKMTLTKMI